MISRHDSVVSRAQASWLVLARWYPHISHWLAEQSVVHQILLLRLLVSTASPHSVIVCLLNVKAVGYDTS